MTIFGMANLQTTQTYLRNPGDPDTSTWYVAHRFSFMAEGRDTGGAFTLLDTLVRRGFEPPPHTHRDEDEAYLVIDGEATFRSGGDVHEAGPGSFVWLPRHVGHSFALHTETARMVILMSPSGLEDAFRECSRPAATLDLPVVPAGPPSQEDIVLWNHAFESRGVVFAPPPV